MSDCGCKDGGELSVAVYADIDERRETLRGILIESVGYTNKQANMLLSNSNGRTLIFEGPVSEANTIVECLATHNIGCEAISKRLLK